MKDFFMKLFRDYIFSALLTVLAGILIIVFHSVAIDLICTVLGALAVAIGVLSILKYFRAPDDSTRLNILIGLIFGALGINIIANPASLTNFVAVAFGIIVLYHGIVNVMNTVQLYKARYRFWYISLIFALITLIAGILLVVLKNRIINVLALVIGSVLIVEGLLNTWIAIKVKKIND